MSGKHTPGPWELTEAGWIEAGDEPVCMIHEGGVTNDTEEADARLIAAAPELLAAAKLARKQLIAAGFDGYGSGLDAAIAKAEGQS